MGISTTALRCSKANSSLAIGGQTDKFVVNGRRLWKAEIEKLGADGK
jgi:hypothetical protein